MGSPLPKINGCLLKQSRVFSDMLLFEELKYGRNTFARHRNHCHPLVYAGPRAWLMLRSDCASVLAYSQTFRGFLISQGGTGRSFETRGR